MAKSILRLTRRLVSASSEDKTVEGSIVAGSFISSSLLASSILASWCLADMVECVELVCLSRLGSPSDIVGGVSSHSNKRGRYCMSWLYDRWLVKEVNLNQIGDTPETLLIVSLLYSFQQRFCGACHLRGGVEAGSYPAWDKPGVHIIQDVWRSWLPVLADTKAGVFPGGPGLYPSSQGLDHILRHILYIYFPSSFNISYSKRSYWNLQLLYYPSCTFQYPKIAASARQLSLTFPLASWPIRPSILETTERHYLQTSSEA